MRHVRKLSDPVTEKFEFHHWLCLEFPCLRGHYNQSVKYQNQTSKLFLLNEKYKNTLNNEQIFTYCTIQIQNLFAVTNLFRQNIR